MKILLKNILRISILLILTGRTMAQDTLFYKEDAQVKKDLFIQPDPLRVWEVGLKYLPTFTTLDLKTYYGDVVTGSVQVTHGFGVSGGYNLNKNIGFQAELNYYQFTQRFRDVVVDRDVTVNYLNIPVLLSLNTDKTNPINLNFVIGPQFGINVGSKIKNINAESTNPLQATTALKSADIGAAYGAGLEFALNPDHTIRVDFGYRGYYGFTDINSNNIGNNSYNVIAKSKRITNAAYIGLTFLF